MLKSNPEKMVHPDYPRFKKIISGIVKKDLKRFINYGDLTFKKGKDAIKIPIRNIDIPHFRYSLGDEGIGQGEDDGGEQAGKDPGEHYFEVEVSLDEIADIIMEELELPNIEPKGNEQTSKEKYKYTDISRTGPDSLRSFKRTFREALKRQLTSGEYNPDDPVISPIKKDTRYKSRKVFESPDINAVLFYVLDVSGSMYPNMQIARRIARVTEILLKHTYKDLKLEYIVHDTEAKRVYNEEDFYRIDSSGGTFFSTAYELCSKVINEQYNPADWNIYVAQFTDGCPFDADEGISSLKEKLLPNLNAFFYTQIGDKIHFFYEILEKEFGEDHNVVKIAGINDGKEVYDAIKKLFSKSDEKK